MTAPKIHLIAYGSEFTACGRRVRRHVAVMEVLHSRPHHVDCGTCLRSQVAAALRDDNGGMPQP